MGKLALRLAFVAAGLNYTALKLGEIFHYDKPLLFNVALCLPAVVLGATSWWAVRSFARSWPVVVCILIVWLGLIFAVQRENHRGVLATSYLTMALPVAALIVEKRCWWLCAKTYVFANAFALGLALWFEYQDHGIGMLYKLYRFGFLMSDDGTMKLANPNVVGGQLAFASVLAFVLYLRTGVQREPPENTSDRPRKFSLAWTVFLALGCILTASRGAFFAWLGGITLLMFCGTRTQKPGRLRDLVAVTSVLLSATLFISVGTGIQPWKNLQQRLDVNGDVFTASGRVLIWKAAYDAWRSNPRYLFFGAGTGAAPEALGRYLGLTKSDGVTPGALDAHNAFVEWLLSFGLIGIGGGVCLLTAVLRKAHRMDRRDGTFNRRAILVCLGLASMNYVTYYQLFFVAAGALVLAMLSEAPAPVPATEAAHGEEVRLHTAAPPGRRPAVPAPCQKESAAAV